MRLVPLTNSQAGSHSAPQIVAVVVLYRMTAEESPALAALQSFRHSSTAAAAAIEPMIWDNTPTPAHGMPVPDRAAPAGFDGIYHHDVTNPGLAAAYDAALQRAVARGARWVMLLDQDTTLTDDYLQEVLALTQTSAAAVLVPRLTCRGHVVSPFEPAFLRPPSELPPQVQGLWTAPLQAFNSGAVFAVEPLRQRGGFDLDFPIDYLDHSSFARVAAEGQGVYVLHTRLEHELASQIPGPLSDGALRRERDILAGERRFWLRYGTPAQRRLLWLHLLRRAVSVTVHKHDLRHARMLLRAALGLQP
jgi:GT2 family glycosyltransferase